MSSNRHIQFFWHTLGLGLLALVSWGGTGGPIPPPPAPINGIIVVETNRHDGGHTIMQGDDIIARGSGRRSEHRVPFGEYTVHFHLIEYYNTPPSQTGFIKERGGGCSGKEETTTFVGEYKRRQP